jgi:nicotinamidase-related amidase
MSPLPLPPHYHSASVGEIWRVAYQQRATAAKVWAEQHHIKPASQSQKQVELLLIDVQNTFCLPDFELFVGGTSGRGAIEDNIRLCEFIYRHLDVISHIIATMDTHYLMQIFHPLFWIDRTGEHPTPATIVTADDIISGKWRINPDCGDRAFLEEYALYYVESLARSGKYPLTIWPYHAMLGGIGHALVPAVEEAIFFHGIARTSQPNFELKGNLPLTENYSVFAPEVMTNHRGDNIGSQNRELIDYLLTSDAVIIAGQAKSHCVAWTVNDLLSAINAIDPQLATKIYLLEDCTSPVVIPGVVDYTTAAEAAYQRFADAGMHIIRSTDDLTTVLTNSI